MHLRPYVSVVIATGNRPVYLRKAFNSVLAQTYDASAFEVVVVQNVSSSEVAEVCTEYRSQFSHFQHVRCDGPAWESRNIGVDVSRGEVVAFLDDDAVADPEWLTEIMQAFNTGDKTVACVGGPSYLIFEQPKPFWLSDKLLPFLGQLDYGNAKLQLTDRMMFFGLNMAFEKQSLAQVGGAYAQATKTLGRTNSERISVSNNDFPVQMRLEARGFKRVYAPGVRVGHHVSASRLRLSWFLRRGYAQGVGDARIYHLMQRRRPGSCIRDTKTLKHGLRALPSLIIPTPKNAVLLLVLSAMFYGYSVESMLRFFHVPRS